MHVLHDFQLRIAPRRREALRELRFAPARVDVVAERERRRRDVGDAVRLDDAVDEHGRSEPELLRAARDVANANHHLTSRLVRQEIACGDAEANAGHDGSARPHCLGSTALMYLHVGVGHRRHVHGRLAGEKEQARGEEAGSAFECHHGRILEGQRPGRSGARRVLPPHGWSERAEELRAPP